jgi:DNA polymerase III alpha subunit
MGGFYQTAYLKAHFPVEFMAALHAHDASTDRLRSAPRLEDGPEIWRPM